MIMPAIVGASGTRAELSTLTAWDLVLDAYRRLTHEQRLFFLRIRGLPTTGDDEELAARLAEHELRTYDVSAFGRGVNGKCSTLNPVSPPSPPRTPSSPHQVQIPTQFSACSSILSPTSPRPPQPQLQPRVRHQSRMPDLPVELIAEILDRLGDWELSKAVGVPTSLPPPLSWPRASPTDAAILTGYLPLIRSTSPSAQPPTQIGATAAIRFGYVHVLEYFLTHHRHAFLSIFWHRDLVPVVASHHGRTTVLSWWKYVLDANPDFPRPSTISIAEAIDGASRNGQVASLSWWLAHSIHAPSPSPPRHPLPFEYTDASLELASSKNRLNVLDWWRAHHLHPPHLPLKPGRSLDFASTAGHIPVLSWWAASGIEFKYDKGALYHASCHGRVDVLTWWAQSGLRLIFDAGEVLVGATKHNRPEVLEWWDKSGLEVQYRMCDIEEALEDAIGGGERAREWWRRKGVDFNATDREWTELRSLN